MIWFSTYFWKHPYLLYHISGWIVVTLKVCDPQNYTKAKGIHPSCSSFRSTDLGGSVKKLDMFKMNPWMTPAKYFLNRLNWHDPNVDMLLNRGSNVDMLIFITNFPRRNLGEGLNPSPSRTHGVALVLLAISSHGGDDAFPLSLWWSEVPRWGAFQSIAFPETKRKARPEAILKGNNPGQISSRPHTSPW